MKIWEAMLKGAKMAPQTFNIIADKNGTCAMGAALQGAGVPFVKLERIKFGTNIWDRFFGTSKYLAYSKQECPVCRSGPQYLLWMIIHLNDVHHWSRECTAHWVRSLEDPESLKEEMMEGMVTA
jgi:hypothetical protein